MESVLIALLRVARNDAGGLDLCPHKGYDLSPR
jgi:hypothetical protein